MAKPANSEQTENVLTTGLTYWVLPCLEALCDIKRLERFIRLHSNEPMEKFSRGYSLAIVLLLERFLDVVVDWNPFDLDEDIVISRAFQGEVPFERMPVDSKLS